MSQLAGDTPHALKDFRQNLSAHMPYLLDARKLKLNEADTSQRICNVFVDVLGYDKHRDISKEVALKGKKADVVLKVKEQHRIVVEIKAATEPLKTAHIEQAKAYGANNGIPCVLLTNGIAWTLYHITWSKSGVSEKQAFHVDLLESDLDDTCESLGILHHDALKANELDHFWARAKALDPMSLSKILFTEDLMLSVRKELRNQHDLLIDVDHIAETLWDMLSADVKTQIGQMKLKKKKKPPAKAPRPVAAAGHVTPEPASQSPKADDAAPPQDAQASFVAVPKSNREQRT